MVNLTRYLLFPRGPHTLYHDSYWKKRQIFKMSAHFYGRTRNCWSIAIRRVQRALQYVAVGRKLRKEWYKDLWEGRITAGANQLGSFPQESAEPLLESLSRSQVLLNRQVLANFAIWEPRTFKAITTIAADKGNREKVARDLGPVPSHVIKGKLP